MVVAAAVHLEPIFEPVIEKAGFKLVRLRMIGGAAKTLQVMAERPDGGMDVDDCAALSHALLDFIEAEVVGRAAQTLAHLPLGERAELAAEVADVGVVDVPVDHVRNGVAVHLLADAVRGFAHEVVVIAARLEEQDEVRFGQVSARLGSR